MTAVPSAAARWSVIAAAGAALVLAVAPARSQTPPQAPRPPPTFHILQADDVVPALILPPPPTDDEAKAEIAELHQIAHGVSQDDWRQAQWDDAHEDGQIFQSAISPAYDLGALPATAKLLSEVRNEEAVAAALAKNYFKRTRPWILDGSLRTCSREDGPQTSYPSGHATMAFAMATVLADVAPTLAPQLMRRAQDYSAERLTCGMHYRSDIVAGQVLGSAVGVLLLRDPRVQADVAASRAELVAAHIIAPP